tara:strand:- start:11 stop:232 length:222 start_codon:yes stop_codon:yes gene_type:complete
MNICFILCGLLSFYDTIFCCQIGIVSIRDDWCGYRQTVWYRYIRKVIPYQTIDNREEAETRTYGMKGYSREIV